MISATNPPINEQNISNPRPLPLARLTNKNLVTKGPKIYTTGMLIKKIAHQRRFINIEKGIMGKMKPLIHGTATKIVLTYKKCGSYFESFTNYEAF